MRRSLLIAAALTLGVSSLAQAQTLVATSNIVVRALQRSIDFTSDTTTSIRDAKMIQSARGDAASFVATDGDIRGVQLEEAFRSLRDQFPAARQANELQLAQAILAL